MLFNANTFTCEDCEDRKVGCHSTCEKYLEAKAECAKVNEARRQSRDAENYHIQSVIKTKKRSERR